MRELFVGLSNVFIYFIIAVAVVFTLRLLVPIIDEVFRKILHFVLLGSILVWTVSFQTWWLEAASAAAFAIIVYPILAVMEHIRNYSEFTTERKKGELKSSLLVVFFMFALVITIAQGVFRDKYLTLASIYAWGIGDAFAALIGKRFGKHPIKGRFLSGEKTVEGTLAMFLTSFAAVMLILTARGGLNAGVRILICAVTAAASAVCELYTGNGMDTFTCPLVSLTALLGMLSVFGGL